MNLLRLKNGRQISVEIKSWNKEIFESINEKEQLDKAFYYLKHLGFFFTSGDEKRRCNLVHN